MDKNQLERMQHGKGFIAALDQSGGSTPKALSLYGISKDMYSSEEEMFHLVHAMRTRIITSPAFSSDYILGAILFEQTMDRTIESMLTADYLWQKKGILPFLKVDKGLMDLEDGVQLMKPFSNFDSLLKRAVERHIFGTKMRSVIMEANPTGIKKIVDQQFEIALKILAAGLMPIIEPEVDIHCPNRAEAESLLKAEILNHLKTMPHEVKLMFKVTIPFVPNFYQDLIQHPNVLRVVALSGGFSQEESNQMLSKNHNLIASFSRALSEGLRAQQTNEEFHQTLEKSIKEIYEASIS